MKNFLTIILLLIFLNSNAQSNPKKYYDYINKAELAICDFKYEKASKLYEKAFKAHTPFISDLFNATILNTKFTKNYNLSLQYSRTLLQRDFEIGWIYREIAPEDSLIAKKFKILEDTVTSLTNQNLISMLEQMIVEDQKYRLGERNNCKIMEVDLNNFLKIIDLNREFGPLNELKIGFHYSYMTLLLHFTQNLYSPKDLLLNSVINGDFNIKKYIELYDIYMEKMGNPITYGRSWGQVYSVDNILIINYPYNIKLINEERKKINMSETWEDYVKKVKYQFINGNFNFYSRIEGYYEEKEVEKLIQEIDQEHQKGIYKREYIRKVK